MKYNADEIFKIAEQIERNGAQFYRKAAKDTENEKHKKLLTELAQMEDRHEEVFAAMRNELTKEEASNAVHGDNNELDTYLEAIASGNVFDLDEDPCNFLDSKNVTMKDLLKKAIQLEKDSILFYLGVKGLVPDELGQKKIQHIIAEEMSHVTMLSQQLSNL